MSVQKLSTSLGAKEVAPETIQAALEAAKLVVGHDTRYERKMLPEYLARISQFPKSLVPSANASKTTATAAPVHDTLFPTVQDYYQTVFARILMMYTDAATSIIKEHSSFQKLIKADKKTLQTATSNMMALTLLRYLHAPHGSDFNAQTLSTIFGPAMTKYLDALVAAYNANPDQNKPTHSLEWRLADPTKPTYPFSVDDGSVLLVEELLDAFSAAYQAKKTQLVIQWSDTSFNTDKPAIVVVETWITSNKFMASAQGFVREKSASATAASSSSTPTTPTATRYSAPESGTTSFVARVTTAPRPSSEPPLHSIPSENPPLLPPSDAAPSAPSTANESEETETKKERRVPAALTRTTAVTQNLAGKVLQK